MGKIKRLILSVAVAAGSVSMGSCASGEGLAAENSREINSFQRALEDSVASSTLPSNLQRSCLDSSRAEFRKHAAKIIADTNADFESSEAVIFLGADYISLSSILLESEKASLVYQDMDSVRVVPIASSEADSLRRLLIEAATGAGPMNTFSSEDGGVHETCVVFSSHAQNERLFSVYRISDLDGNTLPATNAYALLQSILQK